jgi:hypothetical protein
VTGPEKLIRDLLPTRKKQLAYHAELEKLLGIKIYWFCGRWEWKKAK